MGIVSRLNFSGMLTAPRLCGRVALFSGGTGQVDGAGVKHWERVSTRGLQLAVRRFGKQSQVRGSHEAQTGTVTVTVSVGGGPREEHVGVCVTVPPTSPWALHFPNDTGGTARLSEDGCGTGVMQCCFVPAGAPASVDLVATASSPAREVHSFLLFKRLWRKVVALEQDSLFCRKAHTCHFLERSPN